MRKTLSLQTFLAPCVEVYGISALHNAGIIAAEKQSGTLPSILLGVGEPANELGVTLLEPPLLILKPICCATEQGTVDLK